MDKVIEGRKDDTGKLRYDLIPYEPLRLLAEVYSIGAKKYEDRNWEKGIQYGRVFAAMMRHAWKWWNGEQRDAVDGQHHLASVAWTAFALMEYENTHPQLDDRPIKKKKPTTAVSDDWQDCGKNVNEGGRYVDGPNDPRESLRDKWDPFSGGVEPGGKVPFNRKEWQPSLISNKAEIDPHYWENLKAYQKGNPLAVTAGDTLPDSTGYSGPGTTGIGTL